MSYTTYEALCACDGAGQVFFTNSADATRFPKPDQLLFDFVVDRTPVMAAYAGQLHMALTSRDGVIRHAVFDKTSQTWGQAVPVPSLTGARLYERDGYPAPALVALDDLWLFFVDDQNHVQFTRFDGETWHPPAQIVFAEIGPLPTQDTPSFAISDNQLLMCMVDTDGTPTLYYATNTANQDLSNWLPANNGSLLNTAAC